jgi:D-threo-aldose 1-dehydrogenase
MRMGHFLAGRPAGDFIVSTKVGRLLTPCRPGEEESGLHLDPPPFRVSFDYSYDGVMRSLDESLKRLGLDRVDILYVHDVDARTHGGAEGSQARIAELMECGGWRALDRLRASGAVGAVGAGVNETAPCQRLLEVADPDLFLLAGRYTLLEQEPLETLFPACARRGVGIIIGGPYNSGILARAGGSFDYAPAPAEVTRRVARLEAVCARFGASLASAALQFAAAHPIVASVIPGAQNPSEVEANAALMDVPIPVGLWSALKSEGLLAPAAPTPDREARATC